jgi:hypothetical protein
VLVRGTAPAASHFGIDIYPTGTTDENIDSARVLNNNGFGSDLVTGLEFIASESGSYPMIIGPTECSPAGPYSFTENVKHEALLYVSNVVRTSTSKASLPVYVRYPGGSSISDPGLTVYLYGRWRDYPPVPPTNHVLAHGHPVNGTVNLSFKLPVNLAGKRVPMIVTAAGTMYQPVHQVTVTDIVAPKTKA